MMEGSGSESVPPTNGYGSGYGKTKNYGYYGSESGSGYGTLYVRYTYITTYCRNQEKIFIKTIQNKKKLSPQNVFTPIPSVVQV